MPVRNMVVVRMRTRVGVSQREFASRLNVTQSAVAHWERGARHVPGGVLSHMFEVVAAHEATQWIGSSTPQSALPQCQYVLDHGHLPETPARYFDHLMSCARCLILSYGATAE